MTRLGIAIAVMLVATACAAVVLQGEVQQASGKLTLLRVHDVGTKYGPPYDQFDVEVVIQLDSEPDKAFGFQLRPDRHQAAHQGMLDLLRDASNNNRTVTIDYTIEPGKKNGVIIRVFLTRQPQTPQVRVIEVPNIVITADDPILQTGHLDPSLLTQLEPPPDFKGKGAEALAEKMRGPPIARIELEPGEPHEITVTLDEPSLLLARTSWVGSPSPVEMNVVKDGVTLATGETYPVPPDRGIIIASVEINAVGNATVSVINTGSAPVKVEIVVGTLALSLLRQE